MKKGILKFLAGTVAIATLIGGAPLSVQASDRYTKGDTSDR